MNDEAAQTGDQATANYRPFPAFADWYVGGFDSATFDRYETLFKEAKLAATPDSLDAALTAATRYAAVDTGAIEGLYSVDRGFTRTVATQSAAWESVIESRGQHVRSAFEDALGAYEYVLDAVTQSSAVSEMWIRQLHEIVCKSQETYTVYTAIGPQDHSLPKGKYKTMPNSPTLSGGHVHAYAPVLDTAPEMRRFVDELRSEAFLSAHPIVQAAYAHYAYVCVHPFADGNGRVARALASIYLYRSPGVPLVVFADQRNEYFDALELADRGDSAPFIEFIGTRALDAIGIIRSMLQRDSRPLSESLAGINSLFNADAQSYELQTAAFRVRDLAAKELKKQADALNLPRQIQVNALPGHVASVAPPSGYSGVGRDGDFWMGVRSEWPKAVRVTKPMAVFIRQDSHAASDLLIASNANDGLEVWMREVEPVLSETLKLKLAAWVEGRVAEVMGDFASGAAEGRTT